MNALELLKTDHQKVAKILEELADTTEKASKTRQTLLSKLKEELQLHEKIEESIFYPAIKKNPKAKELVAEAYQEHHLIDVILAEMDETPIESEEWKAKLTVLKENIEHHVHEEEHDLFPKVKQTFDNNELTAMADEMVSLKKQTKEMEE